MRKEKLIFLLGNGFSQGFGFPSMGQLWDECLTADNQYKDLLNEAKNKFPLNYFIANKYLKDVKDIELLLTVWNAYIESNDQRDLSNQYTGRAHYENYLKNFCVILHNFFLKNRDDISRVHTLTRKLLLKYNLYFVTTNYDLVIEEMLKQTCCSYHYFNEKVNSIAIRKLHGSISWFPFTVLHFRKQIDGPELIFNNNNYYVYDFSQFLLNSSTSQFVSIYTQFNKDISHSDYAAIIPPLVGKQYNVLFQAVQKDVEMDFKDFAKLAIIGHSFRGSDPIIQDLILTVCRTNANDRAEIFFINKNQEVCEKVKKLFCDYNNFSYYDEEWSVELLNKILLDKNA